MTAEKIRYAIAKSAVGAVGIAATDSGVRAIEIAADPDAVRAEFCERFSAGDLVEDEQGLAEWLRIAVAVVEGPGHADAGSLPLDVSGTAFQRAVWDALRGIEPGTTRTYAQVAAGMGRPTATRAVARACATNQLAVVIPCHRVLRTDGGLSGYRWGVDLKRRLLDSEMDAR